MLFFDYIDCYSYRIYYRLDIYIFFDCILKIKNQKKKLKKDKVHMIKWFTWSIIFMVTVNNYLISPTFLQHAGR